MKEIQFDYVYKDLQGNIVNCTFTLEQIERGELRKRLDSCGSHSYELLAKRQYAGLPDKNGTDVYEGDILRMDSEHDENNRIDIAMKKRGTEFYHCEILYHDDFLFNNVKVFDRGEEIDSTWGDQTFLRYLCKRGYVVGNIYKNPELIKQ